MKASRSKSDTRIILIGTPEFAVTSFQAIVDAGYQVVAVITAPDRKAGRGLKVTYSAVKRFALEHEIPVLQPTNLKSPEFLSELESYRADIQVVIAFRMLPEKVWNMPPLGTFNLHASLLPQYRGAAPINWAIINGEKETGITTFFLKHEIDTGNILFQDTIPIGEKETAGELHDRLMHAGAKLVVKTLEQVLQGDYEEIPQQTSESTKHAPKIFKDDCRINWTKTTEQIYNLIRGLSPYPAAFTTLDDRTLKIFQTEKNTVAHEHFPGFIDSDGKTYLNYYTSDGYLSIKDLQLEGKKRMQIEEFLRGYNGLFRL